MKNELAVAKLRTIAYNCRVSFDNGRIASATYLLSSTVRDQVFRVRAHRARRRFARFSPHLRLASHVRVRPCIYVSRQNSNVVGLVSEPSSSVVAVRVFCACYAKPIIAVEEEVSSGAH